MSKCQRTAIDTPLANVPLFPSIIPEGDKREKGKRGGKGPDPWDAGKGKEVKVALQDLAAACQRKEGGKAGEAAKRLLTLVDSL